MDALNGAKFASAIETSRQELRRHEVSGFATITFIAPIQSQDRQSPNYPCLADDSGPSALGGGFKHIHARLLLEWLILPPEKQLTSFAKYLSMERLSSSQICVASLNGLVLYPNPIPAPVQVLYKVDLRVVVSRATGACPRTRSQRLVVCALQQAKEHGGNPSLTLAGISRPLGLTGAYLGRMIHRFIGITFHTYLRCTRLCRAAYLLTTTSQPVKVVSTQLGYHDPANFCKEFRMACGTSPVRYRELMAIYREIDV